MPFNEDGTRKTMAYKKGPFKMKRSPMKEYSKEAQNLLAAVPNKAAYDALGSDLERREFDKAAEKYGLPVMRA